MPFDVDVLKVDVPADATPEPPWLVTRQSRQRYFEVTSEFDPQTGTENVSYYTKVNEATVEKDSDLKTVLLDKLVSVTPISLDLTSRVDFGDLRSLLES
jgi:5'-nucleotidase